MKENPIKINEMSIKDPRENTVESAMNLKIQCIEKLEDNGFFMRLDLFAEGWKHFR